MTEQLIFDPTKSTLLSGVYSGDGSPEEPASLFINGKWQPASDGNTFTITNPADRSVVGLVSEATEQDTEAAIQVARDTFDAGKWSATPTAERGKMLLKVAQLIRDNIEEFAAAESANTGKRLVESRLDMEDTASAFDYFGTLIYQDSGRVVPVADANVRSRIENEPIGVCALITPWNYPLL